LRIGDAFVMRQVKTIRGDRLFNAAFQPGPTEETMFASHGELRIAELEFCGKDGFVIET